LQSHLIGRKSLYLWRCWTTLDPASSLALILVVLLMAFLPALNMLWNARELAASEGFSGGWIAFQAQTEFLRVQNAVLEAEAYPSEAATDTLMLRASIFASRLSILVDSEEADSIRKNIDVAAIVDSIQADMASLKAMLGTDPADVLDRAIQLRAWRERFSQSWSSLQRISIETLRQNADAFGRRSDVQTLTAVIAASCVGLIAALVSVFAESGRRRASESEKAIALQKAQLHAGNLKNLIAQIPVGIVLHSGQQAIGCNPAACALLGLPTAPSMEAVWRQFSYLTRPRTSSHGSRPASLVSNGKPTSLQVSEIKLDAADGSSMFVGVIADISDSRASIAIAQRASQLAAVGEMAASIAHELNQPLATIALAAENADGMLQRRGESPATPVRAKLARIQEQVARAKRITEHMRRRGRAPANAKDFPIVVAIESALEFCSDQIRLSGTTLHQSNAVPPNALVRGSQTLLEQVILNLVMNCLDAFKTDHRQTLNPAISIDCWIERANVVVTVSDNAGGIDPMHESLLFTPFFTTKSASSGTGLGLSFCKSVVEEMRGNISIKNQNAGSCVTIELPLAEMSTARK